MSQYLYCQCLCTIQLLSQSVCCFYYYIVFFPSLLPSLAVCICVSFPIGLYCLVVFVLRTIFIVMNLLASVLIRLHITDPLTVNYYSMIMLIVIVSLSLLYLWWIEEQSDDRLLFLLQLNRSVTWTKAQISSEQKSHFQHGFYWSHSIWHYEKHNRQHKKKIYRKK